MRIKNTAFAYNVTVQGSSNCDWGTDIGQSKKHTFTLDGFPEFVNAMVYYKIEDVENIEVILGKGNRKAKPFSAYPDNQLVLASCFKKVFLNGKILNGQRFITYIIKEVNPLNSKGQINVHKDRCTLKFSNSLIYNGEMVNQMCIDAISAAFGLSTNGCWAILEMNIENEDELHLKGFALGDSPKDYATTDARNADFATHFDEVVPFESNMIDFVSDKTTLHSQEYSYISAIKTKPFLILGGFSGTGKSQKVKELAFATCPCDGTLNTSETSPGNYLLVSVKPNWHDATDITGFRSSVNRNYYVTDFMRFLVKAKHYPNVPFFVCLDEMNLAPVEEYFADFLSVIESRKKTSSGKIVTDALVPASVFNDSDYGDDFNIFLKIGLKPIIDVNDITEFSAQIKDSGNESDFFEESWLVDELKRDGLTIPQNVIIIGTVNMDDTTNSFSRKVIDRAMTFETVVQEITDEYFDKPVKLGYVKEPLDGRMFISDIVKADEVGTLEGGSPWLDDDEREELKGFINGINADMDGTPFKISYRILNETILLYHSKWFLHNDFGDTYEYLASEDFTDLNIVFDEIMMQKVLPRIEGDYDKCHECLAKLLDRANEQGWTNTAEKIDFMIKRFGKDKSGFTSFWN